MLKMKKFSKKTKIILLAVGLIVIAGIGSVITACTMSKVNNGNDDNKVVATESSTEATEQATEELTELPTEEETEVATEKITENTTKEATEKPTEKKDKSNSDKDKESDKEEATTLTTTTITGGNENNNNSTNNISTGNNTTNNNTQTNSNNNTTTNNTDSTISSKIWHEAEYKTVHHPTETKKVWVVDQEGYTYEEPVYEWKYRTICYTCGADITDNCSEHGRNHMLNGENSSYGNEKRQVQTGTKTVTVEEVGHWETQVVKEAWDEKVLTREAGYY